MAYFVPMEERQFFGHVPACMEPMPCACELEYTPVSFRWNETGNGLVPQSWEWLPCPTWIRRIVQAGEDFGDFREWAMGIKNGEFLLHYKNVGEVDGLLFRKVRGPYKVELEVVGSRDPSFAGVIHAYKRGGHESETRFKAHMHI